MAAVYRQNLSYFGHKIPRNMHLYTCFSSYFGLKMHSVQKSARICTAVCTVFPVRSVRFPRFPQFLTENKELCGKSPYSVSARMTVSYIIYFIFIIFIKDTFKKIGKISCFRTAALLCVNIQCVIPVQKSSKIVRFRTKTVQNQFVRNSCGCNVLLFSLL